MIKMTNAYTTEIDEVDEAVEELLGQIDLGSLGKNTVGILACYYEFIENGIVRELSKRLPFDIIGTTSMASCSNGNYNVYRLQLTVLTSDDVSFAAVVSEPLSGANHEAPLTNAFKAARGKIPGPPAFIISFFPLILDLSSADLLKSFDTISGGVPIWGSVACSTDMNFSNCYTMMNGEAGQHSVVMILVSGPVEPEFIVTALPERNIDNRRAVITKSTGCLLKEANNMSLRDYFSSIGLQIREGPNATQVPLVVDYGDGSKPVALGIYGINADGSALIGGEVPEGASFSIGEIDYEGIMETARQSLEHALGTGKKEGLLMMPCITRYLMLAPKSEDELKLTVELLGNALPYALIYSGGEICPIRDRDGKLHNRHHNFTFSVCSF
jgi:hypothetical protein